eukprot:5827108-Amphidinium_carterae.1
MPKNSEHLGSLFLQIVCFCFRNQDICHHITVVLHYHRFFVAPSLFQVVVVCNATATGGWPLAMSLGGCIFSNMFQHSFCSVSPLSVMAGVARPVTR